MNNHFAAQSRHKCSHAWNRVRAPVATLRSGFGGEFTRAKRCVLPKDPMEHGLKYRVIRWQAAEATPTPQDRVRSCTLKS